MSKAFEKLGHFHKAVGNTIFGWAFVSTVKGEPYFDTGDGVHSDHIPTDSIVPVSKSFMQESRRGLAMHTGDQVAEVIYSYPMTDDIMRGNEITSEKQGLMIGWDTDDEDLIAKVARGEMIGFSIGGLVTEWDIVDINNQIIESFAVDKNAALRRQATRFGKACGYDGADGKMKRRVFRSWKLGEISLVDYPMQEPALVGVVKGRIKPFRKIRTLALAVSKMAMLTTSTEGHQHVIDPMECDHTGCGRTSWETSDGAEYGHDHAWVRDPVTGLITVAENEGHSHNIEASANPAVPPHGGATVISRRAVTPVAENLPSNASASSVKATQEPTQMANEKDPKDGIIETLTKQLDVWKRTASLTDPQRAFFGKLSEDDRTAFLAKTSVERDAMIKSALDADPAHYTAKNGRVFRASERELGDMAKRLDDQDVEIAKANSERDAAVHKTFAKASLSHFTFNAEKGDDVALVKAIHTIDDKDGQRARILTAFKAADASLATTFEPDGDEGGTDGDEGGTEPKPEGAEGTTLDNANPTDTVVNATKSGKVNEARNALQKMADDYAAKNNVHPAIAKRRLLADNAKAKDLYAKAQQHDARMRRAN